MSVCDSRLFDNSRNKNKGKKAKFKIYNKKRHESDDLIIQRIQDNYAHIKLESIEAFSDLPLSPKTHKGLKENGYITPTEIQKASIGHALQGSDILGAAKTGSGKTLAFLVPVLESLYCKKWTHLDGTGALVITPTRELAYQIYETLCKVGAHHDFSAGLIIGGKDLKFERKRMHQCNIVICTPGRLLQHMDENPLFDCVNMQILVLDEADRCLDMGFEQTMNSIIENLPPKRQTLLFSATQTRSVRDLARLSLKDPRYIAVHEGARHATPEGLSQSYIVCEQHDKTAFLWSFIKNHARHKTLVFLATCKQVKYTFEMFCRLRPAVGLLALHGGMHQMKRMAAYRAFCERNHAVLFATDIASRGLDFPAVDWVVQLDCPEDVATYIHRAGRTARYNKGGESLLVLLPSEQEHTLKLLQDNKIPITEIKVNTSKLYSPMCKMEAFLARDAELKASAQRAFQSYLKSVFLMKNKQVFNARAIDTELYARSLGLAVSPRIRFLKKGPNAENTKSATSKQIEDLLNDSAIKENQSIDVVEVVEDREFTATVKEERSNEMLTFNFTAEESGSGDDDILTVKRRDHGLEEENEEALPPLEELKPGSKKKPLTKAAVAKRVLKKNIVANKKIVFTQDGEAVRDQMKERASEMGRHYEEGGLVEGGIDLEEASRVMREEDKFDKKLFRERIKAKHREERSKLKAKVKGVAEEVKEDWSSSDEEPDLSWLPDPDKIYGSESVGEVNSSSGSYGKRKRDIGDVNGDNSTENDSDEEEEEEAEDDGAYESEDQVMTDEEEPMHSGLTLGEDEELALRFLSA